MKVSEFILEKIGTHEIFDHEALCKDFTEKTGMEPSWYGHSVAETKKSIADRGLGGTVKVADGKQCAYGWEIAIGMAEKLVPTYHRTKEGRGSAYNEAVDALQKAGF